MINKITHEGTHDNGVPFTFMAERMSSTEGESMWSFYCTEGSSTKIRVCSLSFPIGHLPTYEEMQKALIKGMDEKIKEQTEEEFMDEDHEIWRKAKRY